MDHATYHFTVRHPPSRYEVEILISGHITLHGLAEHIIDAIGFDFDHAFGFYSSLDHPTKQVERYTLFADMDDSEDWGDDDPGVMGVLISKVFEAGKKMLFYFDYGDDWRFQLECTEVTPAATKRKVREIRNEKGKAPVQYVCEED